MGLNRNLRIGTSAAWQLQILNPDDSVPTGQFLATDALSASVWQGSALAPVVVKAAPDVAWIDATNAQFAINFYPADTAALAPGVYYVDATATRGTNSVSLLPDGTTLTLTDTPGVAAVRPSYVDQSDLRRIAPWIFDVQAPGSETGFADQCADARQWLEENVLRNYQGGYVSLLGEHGRALASFAIGDGATSLRNPWLLQLLQGGPAVPGRNGGLIVTYRTRDICAYYALYRVCDGLITKGAQYAAAAARYRAECYQLLVSYTAELSVSGQVDQWGNLIAMIPVNFGTARAMGG